MSRTSLADIHPRAARRALLAAMLTTAALVAPPAAAETLAITGATIYVSPDRKLEDATLVVTDGKITAIGAGVAIPASARRIDATGKVVTVGLIESACQLGLVEVELEPAGGDGRFGTAPTPIHAAFRATDSFDPRSVAIPVARTGGVTSAIAGPTGGLLSGQSAWMSLADAARPAAPVADPAAMNAALGALAIG
ncbi:MAG TPA: hypothetical protein PKU97_05630, partial [Kofleriaceae bacterium]|nr:hypothetical protein [Kofleriaceae bacterium]